MQCTRLFVRKRLNELLKDFRANRQQIINLDFVESLVPWPNDGYLVRLAGGREIEMSRRQARLFHAARRL